MSDEELFQISASAYLKLVLHVFRFWSVKPLGQRNIVYGLLMGFLEGNTRTVEKVLPISHREKRDLEMDEEFIKKIGKINKQELEAGSMNEVIGWYRSSNDGIKFTARDIKNHINFQSHHHLFIGLIFDPKSYLDPETNGFSVFRLEQEERKEYYNMMSDFYKIPWEIQDIKEPSRIITDFRMYIGQYFNNEPLIKELDE